MAVDVDAISSEERPSKRSEIYGVADETSNRIVIFGGNEGPIVNQIPKASYVDETWTTDGDPYYGDAVNSYNHSGPETFFELESSSPALELAPGEGHTHRSTTMQFRFANEEHLATAVRHAFGIDWAEVQALADWN